MVAVFGELIDNKSNSKHRMTAEINVWAAFIREERVKRREGQGQLWKGCFDQNVI
jgi:hypothetical protein